MKLGTLEKIRDVDFMDVQKALKGNAKMRDYVWQAIEDVKNDLTPGKIETKLVLVHNGQRLELEWRDYIIGNSDKSNIQIKATSSNRSDDYPISEGVIRFVQGNYLLLNTLDFPLRDIYIKMNPSNTDQQLRPDTCLKMGDVELKVCRFNVGRAENQGTRNYMEDRSIVVQDMRISPRLDVSMFGVFDGHRGSNCAQYLLEQLPFVIKQNLMSDAKNQPVDIENLDNMFEFLLGALQYSCSKLDANFLEKLKNQAFKRGSTCVTVLIIGDHLICMNVGDSRAIMSRNKQVIQLSRDHKPNDPLEKHRITQAQGIVEGGRVCIDLNQGGLTTSRSFGDFDMKPSSSGEDIKRDDVVTSEPEIREIHLDFVKDDFIVLGCDGLFESLNNQEIVDFVYNQMVAMPIGCQDTQKVAEDLVIHALNTNKERSKEGSDNITAIIVPLTRGILRSDGAVG